MEYFLIISLSSFLPMTLYSLKREGYKNVVGSVTGLQVLSKYYKIAPDRLILMAGDHIYLGYLISIQFPFGSGDIGCYLFRLRGTGNHCTDIRFGK